MYNCQPIPISAIYREIWKTVSLALFYEMHVRYPLFLLKDLYMWRYVRVGVVTV